MSYEQPSNPQQTMQYNFVNMGLNHGLNDPNMMAMMNMNRNMDMYVTLLSRSTLAYCSHCNAVVMTKLETPKALYIFLAVFFSCFLLIPILGFVNAEYLAYVMPVIFVVLVILFVIVFVTSFKTKHFCPVCKQYIGKTRDSVRIPARSEP